MKRLVATTIVILTGSGLLLVPVWLLHFAVLRMERMENASLRPLAELGVLALGIIAFLAGTWASTHLAVRLFHNPDSANPLPR